MQNINPVIAQALAAWAPMPATLPATVQAAQAQPQTDAQLITRAALLKLQLEGLEKEYKAIIDGFKARGPGDYLGEGHTLQVRQSERATLDSAIVKGFLTPAQLVAATKTATVTTATIR